MKQRKRWHVRHHHVVGCYGVTTSFWDKVFGTTGDRRPRPCIVARRSPP
jgi:sterol desaturase/sphingolipid hydroxylase (fatty acid hydroxylase superfamily)